MQFTPSRLRFIFLGCVFLNILGILTFHRKPLELIKCMNGTYNCNLDLDSAHANVTMMPAKEIFLTLGENSNSTGIETISSNSKSAFFKILGSFDWDYYMNVVKKKNSHEIDVSSEKLIQILQDFLVLEPKVPVNSECKAPPLTPPGELNCSSSKFGTAFTGELNKKLPKIGILLQFGFGVDVLEMYLNEMYDVVDYLFILESTRSHYRTLRKMLIWEKVKRQERFTKFEDKVVHLIIDDADNSELTKLFKNRVSSRKDEKMWVTEFMQERLRWNKFLKWNAGQNFFGDDDLIGFGDADEIPAREMVHMLKYCSIKPGSVDVGIWFPFGNINYAFASDFPVLGHKYTLGDPTFFTLKSANEFAERQKGKSAPNRQRGKGDNYILGGIHMTHYGYLPYQLIQELTCSECGIWTVEEIEKIRRRIRNNEIRELEMEFGAFPTELRKRVVKLSQIPVEEQMKEIAILPWFYDCNRNRYPVWEGNHDSRMD